MWVVSVAFRCGARASSHQGAHHSMPAAMMFVSWHCTILFIQKVWFPRKWDRSAGSDTCRPSVVEKQQNYGASICFYRKVCHEHVGCAFPASTNMNLFKSENYVPWICWFVILFPNNIAINLWVAVAVDAVPTDQPLKLAIYPIPRCKSTV